MTSSQAFFSLYWYLDGEHLGGGWPFNCVRRLYPSKNLTQSKVKWYTTLCH